MKSNQNMFSRRQGSKARPSFSGRVFAPETPMDNPERLYWNRLNSAMDEFFNPEQCEIVEAVK